VSSVARDDALKVIVTPFENAKIGFCSGGGRLKSELCVVKMPFGLPVECGLDLLD
jgi:hypothetical protein